MQIFAVQIFRVPIYTVENLGYFENGPLEPGMSAVVYDKNINSDVTFQRSKLPSHIKE